MILSKENIKTINLDLLIDEKIKSDRLESFLLIVPTNRKLRTLKKEVITLSSRQVTAAINIETLTTLSKKMLEQVLNFHELSEEASAVFIEQSAQAIQKKYFTNYRGAIPSGTLERIQNVITKYKEEGITPELLRKEASALEKMEKLKALDIANIYDEYINKCKSLNAFELGDIYKNLDATNFDSLTKSFRVYFNRVKLIIIDGFTEFTNLELSIINRIASIDDLQLFINFDYSSYNKLLFAHLEETYDKLYKFGFKEVEDKSIIPDNKFIESIKGKLFLETSGLEDNRFKNKLVKIIANSREKEVELIAKEIKSLLLLEEIKPHEICVTFNIINNYSSIVRDVFHVYGVPFNLTDRVSLDKTLSVTAVINFLEIAESDYYYKSILRSLSNSFIEIEGFDINALLYSATKLKIIIGRENWNYNLSNAIDTLDNKFDNEDKNKNTEIFKKTLHDLKKLDDFLSPFQKKLTPTEFSEELKNLIRKLDIALKLLKVENGNRENDVKSLTTFLNSIEEIFHLLELETPNVKYNLSFYLDRIRTLSQSARFNIKERSDYGVLITNIEEIRGLKFKYTFLGGMIDGDFPTKYQPEIFFSGSFAKKERHHLNEERYRFYQALKSWSNLLYLTYPLSDGEKETVKSTFIEEFEKKFKVSEKSEDDFNDFVYSTEELQRDVLTPNFPVEKISDREFNSNLIEWEKAVSIDQQRLKDVFQLSPFSGDLFASFDNQEQQFKEKLVEMQTKAYSISQLETYTACPFRYFLERVLKIEISEEPDEEIEAVELGSLLHSILFDFYIKIRKKNIVIKNCSDKVFKMVEEMLFDIAKKHVDEITKRSPFGFYEEEKIFGINSNREDSLLHRFILNEREDNSNRDPNYFEVSFGVKNNIHDEELFSSEPLIFEDIKLRGVVDRVDINKTEKSFEVIDYKSGAKKVTKAEIEKGSSLQLPIYVWAVKTLLHEKLGEEYSPKAMSIYNLKYQNNIFGKNAVYLGRSASADSTLILNDLIDQALEHVKRSVNKILEGKFPLTPFTDEKDKICKYCDFHTICRIDEIVK